MRGYEYGPNWPFDGTVGGISAIILIVLIVTWILWFFLPFAVFGIKSRLDTIIAQQRELIDLLSGKARPKQPSPYEFPLEDTRPATKPDRIEPQF